MIARPLRLIGVALAMVIAMTGCSDWRGANSLPLPGTKGGGAGSYTIQVQLPDVDNIDRNSRVRVGDVTVGNVTDIQRQGWHALLTMTINGDVDLPANATATIGQTSLLGSLHVELAAPKDVPPEGKLTDGAVIPLSSGGAYPSTEQTLAAVSVLLNGGGIGQIQDIVSTLATAFNGREDDLRSLLGELDKFVSYLNDQTDDIIAASDSLNKLAGQIAEQKPVVDKALKTIPEALAVLNDQRGHLVDALDTPGQVQRTGRRLRQHDQGEPGQGTSTARSGAEVPCRRRPGADPVGGLLRDLPVPTPYLGEVAARRFREPDRDHRSHAESPRCRSADGDSIRRRAHGIGVAVGPDDRSDAESVHGTKPARCALPVQPGALTCA